MDWAVKAVLMTRKLPKEDEFEAVKRQLVRSAPSSAANYRAACRGKSGADFINKLKIAEDLFATSFTKANDAKSKKLNQSKK